MRSIDDQRLLLTVVAKIFPYLEEDESISEISWQVILLIFKRGEFTLSNIGFSKIEQDDMQVKITSFHKKKLKIGLNFQEALYKLLVQSLRLGYI